MTKDQIAVCWLCLLAVPGVLALTLKGDSRKRAANILLLTLTAFVAFYLFVMFASPDKLARATAKTSVDQAELPLRLQSCTSAAQAHLFNQILQAAGEKQHDNKLPSAGGAAKFYETAETALSNAIKQYPNDTLLKAKLAVLLATRNNDGDLKKAQAVAGQLATGRTTATDKRTAKELGETLKELYGGSDKAMAAQSLAVMEKVIDEQVPPGWYRDNVLSQLYRQQHDQERLEKHNHEVDEKYWRMFVKLGWLLGAAVPAFAIGVIVILIQLGVISRKAGELPDEVGLDVLWKSVYIVFVGWFATQLIASYLVSKLMLVAQVSGKDPLQLALTTTVGYLLSNGPGLFCLYWFAIRPGPFLKTIKLTWRTSTAGAAKLILFGYLSWCSMLPLVTASGWVASHYLGTQGSDNPVIAQLVQAAGSPNWLATLLFYITLGVLAPLCEETLFRGFLYGALKRRWGTLVAVALSAALFSLLHFDRGGLLMLFTIGCVLAYTFERTRSLTPCMIAHGLWNSGSFSLALILFGTS